tara:strand:+ start:41268 stop:41633 length:366 start_codon:yes stop_codon:yes gene_type:complete
MSYFPQPTLDITTSEAVTGMSFGGDPVTATCVVDATLAVGTNDHTSEITSITKLAAIYGGCDRDGGETYAFPVLAGSPTTAENVRNQILATGTDLRIAVGSAWTGAGNLLTNGVVVLEYTL